MTSVFGWLDNDDKQQKQMTALIELFKDESTVDELGIGTIRDTIANQLFPATSVLQTRARYLLFTAWLIRDVARRGLPTEQAIARLRSDEVRLIDALLQGGERDGVIGNQAKGRLKNMPSRAYWAGMGRLGIRTWDLSISGHLRAASVRARATSEDMEELGDLGLDLGIDASAPPMPSDLLTESTFDLRAAEAGYLKDRIAAACPDSAFAWLALKGEPVWADYIWQHPQLPQFPIKLQSLIDHGRRFHHAIHGAALLYNLMLADKRGDGSLTDDFRASVEEWQQDLDDERVFDGWDRGAFWSTLTGLNPRLHPATKAFVNAWLTLAESGNVADDKASRDLIRAREIKLKGGRARLTNPAALDAWSERAGLVRLDYRWGVASRHLDDIHTGLGIS
jgi:hypothetical protein